MTTYRDAGVNIEAGDLLVERIQGACGRTHIPGVLGAIGGFGALFSLKDFKHYDDPILVSGTDGVGTKLKVAMAAGRHDTIGIDLVAMCANDIVCHGAQPLFFLDYYASGRLEVAHAQSVIEGIAKGCALAGCALVGGETAEMPGFYAGGEYDVAGFCVGVTERAHLLPQTAQIQAGDVVIGLMSSGLHSNGYSLARTLIFDTLGLTIHDPMPLHDQSVAEVLLTPTRLYVAPLMRLLSEERSAVKALAHITGGGLIGNVPRVLPEHHAVQINPVAWRIPKIFSVLQAAGHLTAAQMFETFNMGIGMVIITAEARAQQIIQQLNLWGESAWAIGKVVKTQEAEPTCQLLNPKSTP